MSGREKDESRAGPEPGPAPGLDHFPLPRERKRRLEVLVDLHRKGLYRPDYEKLANALLDKEPGLFDLEPGERGDTAPDPAKGGTADGGAREAARDGAKAGNGR